MSSYLDKQLADHEQVRMKAHRHVLWVLRKAFLMAFLTVALWVTAVIVAYREITSYSGILAVLLLLISLVPGVVVVIRFLRWRNELYVITNYRIIQVEGILSKRSLDSSLGRINDVEMKQPLFGRLFGFGDIFILTGSAHSVNDLLWINQPFEFKQALIDAKAEFDGRYTPPVPGQQGAASMQHTAMSGSTQLPPPDQPRPPQTAPIYTPPPAPATQPVPTPDMDDTSRFDSSQRMLVSLNELRNAGVLSEDEYQEKVRKITGR